jgi:hypothetical protein
MGQLQQLKPAQVARNDWQSVHSQAWVDRAIAWVEVTWQLACPWMGTVHLQSQASVHHEEQVDGEQWLMGLLHSGALEQRWGLEVGQ